MTRRCSHCGHNGHNSRTCSERGTKLGDLKLTEQPSDDGSMRKSASLSNLSTGSPGETSGGEGGRGRDGYHSDSGLIQPSSKERKKGVPWTEEEHRLFLLGLRKLGKGDWRGISRNFVPSRTPTQVASHAQKYFIRQSNLTKRKRRSSLFDISSENFGVTKSIRSSHPSIPVVFGGQQYQPFQVAPVYYDSRVHPYPQPYQPQPTAAAAVHTPVLPAPAFKTTVKPLPVLLPSCSYPATEQYRPTFQAVEHAVPAQRHVARPVPQKALAPDVTRPMAQRPVPQGAQNVLTQGQTFSLGQGQGFQRVGGPASREAKATKVCRPTASVPVIKRPNTGLQSVLPQSSPPMEPSPLSFKLLEHSHRHSAFHPMSSAFGTPSMGAISVS